MKLINASYEILDNGSHTTNQITKDIEIAARNCYKSEDKINIDSDTAIVNKLFSREHFAMLEFGKNICIKMLWQKYDDCITDYNIQSIDNEVGMKYFEVTKISDFDEDKDVVFYALVSSSLRGWFELFNKWKISETVYSIYYEIFVKIGALFNFSIANHIDSMMFDNNIRHCIRLSQFYNSIIEDNPEAIEIVDINTLSEEQQYIHNSITVRFICDRGISHELVRHEGAFSFAQESTRFCNYSKDENIVFIIPSWMPDIKAGIYKYHNVYGIEHEGVLINNEPKEFNWIQGRLHNEFEYNKRIKDYNESPSEARSVLPNSLKTEVIMKGNIYRFKHFFKERCGSGAHIQMKELTIPMYDAIVKLFPLINYK